jgi:hypothetical protein
VIWTASGDRRAEPGARVDETLAALIPSAAETALLHACLDDRERARQGWRLWPASQTAGPIGLADALARWRTLMPLLARAASRHELDLGSETTAYVRAAALREELRATRVRDIASGVLDALDAAALQVFVVGGAALAATVYESWALRHCHDVDLLVDDSRFDEVTAVLGRAGLERLNDVASAEHRATFRHASGLEFVAHTLAFDSAFHAGSRAVLPRGDRTLVIGSRTARTVSPEALLVHVLGQASVSAGRCRLVWVADAWHLLSRHTDLDWDDVLTRIADHRLDLPAATLITYLSDVAPSIPSSVVMHLRARAAAADHVARDVALGGMTAAVRGDLAYIWRATRSWRARLRFARWAIAPSPAYVRAAFHEPAAWQLPLCYLYRPARFVAERLASPILGARRLTRE